MNDRPIRSEGEPHDRLTRVCDAMVGALEAHPESAEGDKCIVFLTDDEYGGMVLHGYDDDAEAMADLLMHIKALFQANGKEFILMPLNRG